MNNELKKQINYIKNIDTRGIIEKIDYGGEIKNPKASIVMAVYNTNKKLLNKNLKSLEDQNKNNFEVIIIDNSDKLDMQQNFSKYSIKYFKMNKNYGLNFARNLGTKFSRSNIIIFLDDDAIPEKDFVQEHINAHKKYNIFGLRGKCLPRTKSIYNYLAGNYDLGDKIIPSRINLEGNSSFKKNILIETGGFNTQITGAGGNEGSELSFRIIQKYKDKRKLIYYPKAIIRHDFAKGLIDYLEKHKRHKEYKKKIANGYPDFFKFINSYNISKIKIIKPKYPQFIKLKLKVILKVRKLFIKFHKI